MKRRMTGMASSLCLGVVAGVLLWTAAAGALEPDEKCQALKNKDTGKLAFCMQKAEMKLVKTKGTCSVTASECYRDGDCPVSETCVKDLTKYDAAVLKCETKFLEKWAKNETKAADKGGSCPDGIADPNSMLDFVTGHSGAVTLALDGGGLPACGDDLINVAGEECDGTALAGKDCTAFGMVDGTLACSGCVFDTSGCLAPGGGGGLLVTGQTACDPVGDGTGYPGACPGTPAGQDGEFQFGTARSYTDNGDGTITDNVTGLMWEVLCDEDPAGATCPADHDMDTTYTWVNAFAKVAAMNTAVYAGHSYWRLPNRFELDSLVDLGRVSPAIAPAFNTGCVAPCSATTCSCTRSNFYWSSTTYQSNPTSAWFVYFGDGFSYADGKSFTDSVRAVRGGS